MIDPLLELVELLRAVGSDGYIVVGGLAVRLLVGENSSRETRDVDIVAMNRAAQDRMLSYLRSIGYHIGTSGGWHRTAMKGKPIIDVAPHPVVNPRTFEELTLQDEPIVQTLSGVAVPLVSPNDLAFLKLVAHRDQDIVDLFLLAGRLTSSAIAERARHDDVERTAAEGAQSARLLSASGALVEVVEELVGRRPTPKELDDFDMLLRALQKEGI